MTDTSRCRLKKLRESERTASMLTLLWDPHREVRQSCMIHDVRTFFILFRQFHVLCSQVQENRFLLSVTPTTSALEVLDIQSPRRGVSTLLDASEYMSTINRSMRLGPLLKRSKFAAKIPVFWIRNSGKIPENFGPSSFQKFRHSEFGYGSPCLGKIKIWNV